MGSDQPKLRAEHRTLRELVQNRLLEDIIQARFSPGQRLYDTELAELYGVSRGPIREAIRSLEGQGLLSVTPFKGAVVTRLTRVEVAEIYQMRIELEGLAARLAVSRITDEAIDGVRQHLERMAASIDSPDEWHAHTDEFHLALYEWANSPRLFTTIRDLMRLTMPYARLYLIAPGVLLETHPDHERILAAVESRDVRAAEDITESHLEKSSELIVKLIAAD